MNEEQRYRQVLELREERDFWKKVAIQATVIAAAFSILIFCFGLGQLICGG